jgi:hypothetical protein
MEKIDTNSMDLEWDQILCYLALGSRTPQNESEKIILKQIKDIEAKGNTVDIPFN